MKTMDNIVERILAYETLPLHVLITSHRHELLSGC